MRSVGRAVETDPGATLRTGAVVTEARTRLAVSARRAVPGRNGTPPSGGSPTPLAMSPTCGMTHYFWPA
jgi:hypothetical protein